MLECTALQTIRKIRKKALGLGILMYKNRLTKEAK
jgi:hypothetical protein